MIGKNTHRDRHSTRVLIVLPHHALVVLICCEQRLVVELATDATDSSEEVWKKVTGIQQLFEDEGRNQVDTRSLVGDCHPGDVSRGTGKELEGNSVLTGLRETKMVKLNKGEGNKSH